MKIGIYDPYLDDLGGGEKYMMTIASCLSEQSDVTVFWNNSSDLKNIVSRFGLDLTKVSQRDNIFAQGYPFFKRLRITAQFDSIFFLSDGSFPVSLSRKLFIHFQQPLNQMQNATFKDKIKLSRVTKIFCNSEFTKNSIEKKFHIKSVVLYPPVSLHPKSTAKENYILHVGRFRTKNVPIDDYKKQWFMVEAFKQMVQKGLNGWKFMLAVSVQEKDQEVFQRLKKSARGYPIEFFVNQANEKLWDLYSKAKIYWHASGYGENLAMHPEYAEHFGISTVEAMGSGCVPIVINAGGQIEIVTDNVNGFLWNTEKELLEKTLRLIHYPKLWKKFSSAATERSKLFNEKRFCNQIHNLLHT